MEETDLSIKTDREGKKFPGQEYENQDIQTDRQQRLAEMRPNRSRKTSQGHFGTKQPGNKNRLDLIITKQQRKRKRREMTSAVTKAHSGIFGGKMRESF